MKSAQEKKNKIPNRIFIPQNYKDNNQVLKDLSNFNNKKCLKTNN